MSFLNTFVVRPVNTFLEVTVTEPVRELCSNKYSRKPKAQFAAAPHAFSFIQTLRKQRKMCSPDIRAIPPRSPFRLREYYLDHLGEMNLPNARRYL